MPSFKCIVEAHMSSDAINQSAQNTAHDAPQQDLVRDEYIKGNVLYQGIAIAIENPVGSVRRGDGWETRFTSHYGEIIDSMGNDGDGVDVFIGDNPDSQYVLVVNQNVFGGKPNEFDEHKIMLGYNDRAAALKAYYAHHSSDWPDQPAFDASIQELKAWLAGGDKRSPYNPYHARNKALDARRGGDLNAVTMSFFSDVFARLK
ncbi:hypothetical protein VPHK356_0042 [Vibrio phage K356]|nr:hypothetical protein MYOV002v2_p0038 [Vibrio phage 144E46.1]